MMVPAFFFATVFMLARRAAMCELRSGFSHPMWRSLVEAFAQ
jgi:hypothetical protein